MPTPRGAKSSGSVVVKMGAYEDDDDVFNSAVTTAPLDLTPQNSSGGLDSFSVKNWKKVKLALNASRAFRGKRDFTESSSARTSSVRSGRSSRSNSSVSNHTRRHKFKTAAQAVLAGVRMSSTNKGKMEKNGEHAADVTEVQLNFDKPGGFAVNLDELCDLMEKRTPEALQEMGGKSILCHCHS